MKHVGVRALVVAASCACANTALAQNAPEPTFIQSVWVTVGAGSVDPAPYWQRKWSATFPHVGGDNHVDRIPELAASLRFELSEAKQLEVGVTRWRVGLTSQWDSSGRTVRERHHDRRPRHFRL
jgi:hypothetical protein